MVEVGDIIHFQMHARHYDVNDFAGRVEVGTIATTALTENHIDRIVFKDFSRSSTGKEYHCDAWRVEDWFYALIRIVGVKPDKYKWRLRVDAEVLEVGSDQRKMRQKAIMMQRERQRGINL